VSQVADDLVAEHRREVQESGGDSLDHDKPKNIRRRVYDALNVLMALNIISKDRKRIRWIGLPTNTVQEYRTYEIMRQKKQAQVDKLKRHLRDLVLQVSWYGRDASMHVRGRWCSLHASDGSVGTAPGFSESHCP
jgi:hypothetical protein